MSVASSSSSPCPRPRRALFTMVTSDDFCIGAHVLAWSLRQVATRYPLFVLVTPNLSDDSLRSLQRSGWSVVTVEPLPSGIQGGHVASWGEVGYTKLRLWQLHADWDRILYVDADCLVNRNLDHLLDEPALDAVSFAAAPDIFPPDHFNAGVMLLSPSAPVFSAMLQRMSCTRSYDGGDTGFLNHFFPDWWTSKCSVSAGESHGQEQIVVDGPQGSADPSPADIAASLSLYRARTARLSFGYNALRVLQWFTKKAPAYWGEVHLRGRLVTHYCSSPKPWEDLQHKRGGSVEQEYFKAMDAMHSEMETRPEVSGQLERARMVQAPPPAVTAASSSAERQAQEEPSQALQSYVRRHVDQSPFGEFPLGDAASASGSKPEITGAVRPIKRGVWMDSVAEDAFLAKTRSMLRACFDLSSFAAAAPAGIPRVIHQIWLGGSLPAAYAAWAQSWTQHNPASRGWQYKLWGDAEFAGFPACAAMQDETSQQLAAHLRALLPLCTNVAQRSDLWRLDLLWTEGGLYVDTDFECFGSFDALHSPSSPSSSSCSASEPATSAAAAASPSFYTGFSNVGAVECNNGLIASAPRHPLIAKLILSTKLQPPAAVSFAASTHSAMEIVCSSGPGHFTRTCAEFVASADVGSRLAFFPAQAFYPLPNSMRHLRQAADKHAFVAPCSMAMHHWSCSWQSTAAKPVAAKEAASEAAVAAPTTTAQVLAMVQAMQAAKLQQAPAPAAASAASTASPLMDASLMARIAGFMNK